MDFKKYISEKINIDGVKISEIYDLIAVPPTTEMGDFTLPCFKLSKIFRKPPVLIANELKENFSCDEIINEVSAINGYLNFKVSRKYYTELVMNKILSEGDKFGSSDEGNEKTVCIDYSSVNIAKPFHIGHLSTTVIGGALYRISNFLGYNTVGINHLGDYGTQFGKLICAYKRWGNAEMLKKGGIKALNELYVRFHKEAEENPALEDEARSYFKNIEDKDPEALTLFNTFKELTLKEVGKIYELLDIKFDSWAGESFYNDKMQPVIDLLQEKNLLKTSDGAKIVDLSNYNMPPCLILRSDGATLYATRDLAAAIYRHDTYDFYKCLYVVAYQQNLHFQQFFKVLELAGETWAKDLVHVSYGMVSLEDGAMSTRKGNVILLEDVINKCIDKAYNIINDKNPSLENKTETAKKIGVGAVIFGALFNSKIKDTVFSYDKVLNFEGETGVYCQYTYARANSVLQKGNFDLQNCKYSIESVTDEEYELIKALANFNDVVKNAFKDYEPYYITRFAVDIAQKFNKFYFDCKILTEEDNIKNFRLNLTKATSIAIKNALSLLGISVIDKM